MFNWAPKISSVLLMRRLENFLSRFSLRFGCNISGKDPPDPRD